MKNLSREKLVKFIENEPKNYANLEDFLTALKADLQKESPWIEED